MKSLSVFGFRIPEFEVRVSDFGFRISDFGFQISGLVLREACGFFQEWRCLDMREAFGEASDDVAHRKLGRRRPCPSCIHQLRPELVILRIQPRVQSHSGPPARE